MKNEASKRLTLLKMPVDPRPVLITGGAGFIGTNLADHLLSRGQSILIFDNLSRKGVEKNFEWLSNKHGSLVELERGDVRDRTAVRSVVRHCCSVFHFAAQVAVTTSLVDPVSDFEVNALGTLNVLEAIRSLSGPIPLLFTSTNKVYGICNDVALEETGTRYEPVNPLISSRGISEARPLDFHSPYGCSKGTADQYVLDYARSYRVPAVVFRMSCIYGPHQYGTEDQGWIAHFIIQTLKEKPLTIYGDGKQVRDILYVDDLVQALLLAHQNIEGLAARAFNMGGGTSNTISLIELIRRIEDLHQCKLEALQDRWRQGDQRYYVSDTTLFRKTTGWKPLVSVEQGLQKIYEWLTHHHKASVLPKTAAVGYEIRSY